MNKFWKKQNKKLNELQNKIDNMQSILDKLEKELEEEKKLTRQVQRNIKKEFIRRDAWEIKAAEVNWLAKGKSVWVIKCPMPEGSDKNTWGVYCFAVTLQNTLNKLGCYAVVDIYEEWSGNVEADVVIVLRGKYQYRPDRRNKKCTYIMWHVGHPDMVECEEYELFDLVLIDSISYAEKIAQKVSVPVKPFLVCADTNIFYPGEEEPTYGNVFVGNTRGVYRGCVEWCEKNEIPLHLWGRVEGNGWKQFIDANSFVKLEGGISNEELPNIYRQSKIILNDHYDDMRNEGFFNNRTFEGLCCGRPVISDYHPDFEKVFGDCVLFYHNEEDFVNKLKMLSDNYDEYRQRVLEIWPKLKQEYSFEARASELIEMIKLMKEL